MNTFDRAQACANKLYAIREQIHRHPEMGNQEFKTAALVEETLHGLGIETQRVTETGVVGTLTGGQAGKNSCAPSGHGCAPRYGDHRGGFCIGDSRSYACLRA